MSRYRVIPYGDEHWAVEYLGDGWCSLPSENNTKWQCVRDREAIFDGTKVFPTEEAAETFCRDMIAHERREADEKARHEARAKAIPPREITT